jgi:hypothetical protein
MALTDVPCDTILIIECNELDVHWMAPGDIQLNDISRNICKGTDGKGIVVGFADGCVWLLDESVPFQELKRFFIAAHVNRDREAILGPYRLLSTTTRRACNCLSKSEVEIGVGKAH